VRPSKRRSKSRGARATTLPLNWLFWIFAVIALAATSITEAHPPIDTLLGQHGVPVWIAASEVPSGPIALGAASADLKTLAMRIANATYPCAALALMQLRPADAQNAHERSESFTGVPTAATVALVADGANSDAVSESLRWIWDGPYVATGHLNVEIRTTTVRGDNGNYVTSVVSRIVDLNGFPLTDLPSLEPPFRFLWSAQDSRLLGVFRLPE
jgi:hypothetical protein